MAKWLLLKVLRGISVFLAEHYNLLLNYITKQAFKVVYLYMNRLLNNNWRILTNLSLINSLLTLKITLKTLSKSSYSSTFGFTFYIKKKLFRFCLVVLLFIIIIIIILFFFL